VIVLISALACPHRARADEPAAAAADPAAPAARPAIRGARSIGTPQEGRLESGRRLRQSAALRYLPDAAPRGRSFGTEELVDVLRRGAEDVARRFPGSVLRVGDLSTRGGGDVHMHASHESGRDADVAFYLRSPTGEDVLPPRFVEIGPEGKSPDGAVAFDDERNWAFLESILASRRALVTHVFVAEHLRTRMLVQAQAAGAPARLVARAESILSQPRGSFPHDNHFHVRVACAVDDRPECVEGVRRQR
jgi:penicillin-insensitive murein endopeptidase